MHSSKQCQERILRHHRGVSPRKSRSLVLHPCTAPIREPYPLMNTVHTRGHLIISISSIRRSVSEAIINKDHDTSYSKNG